MADSEALRLFMEFLNNNGGGARPSPGGSAESVPGAEPPAPWRPPMPAPEGDRQPAFSGMHTMDDLDPMGMARIVTAWGDAPSSAPQGRTVTAPPRPPSGAPTGGSDLGSGGMGFGDPDPSGFTRSFEGKPVNLTPQPSVAPRGVGGMAFGPGGAPTREPANSGVPPEVEQAVLGDVLSGRDVRATPVEDKSYEWNRPRKSGDIQLPMPGGRPPGQAPAGGAPQLSNMGGGPAAGAASGAPPVMQAGPPGDAPPTGARSADFGGASRGPAMPSRGDLTRFAAGGAGAPPPAIGGGGAPMMQAVPPSAPGGAPRPAGPRARGDEAWKTYENATGKKWTGGGSDEVQQLVRQLQIGGKAGSAEQNLALQKALRDPAVMKALQEKILGAATMTTPGGAPAGAPPGGAPQGLTPEEWLALQGSSR